MALPTNIGAYTDCIDYYEQALATKRGLRVQFADRITARRFYMRMQQARSLDRDESRRVYERDSPKWNRSEFDCLQVKSPVEDTEGHWWVYIEPHNARVTAVEEVE